MAKLTAALRRAKWADLMAVISAEGEPLGLTKAQFRAAVDATDDFIDDQRAAYNTALPAAARSALTVRQKARLYMAVAEARFDEA